MFDPAAQAAKKAEAAKKKKAASAVKEKCYKIIPIELQEDLLIDVKEVICGDPECAPIDTVITMVWNNSQGRGMFGIPMAPDEIVDDDIIDFFPDNDTLAAWARGEAAEWPKRPAYRFGIMERVECRIGPDPVTGWAPGRIVATDYRQAGWPPGASAPYQIWLHDGRLIFAPQDTDNVIRLRPSPDPTSPPSPPVPDHLRMQEGDGGEE